MKFKSITSFISGLFSKEGDEGRIPQGFLINAHNVDIDNTGLIKRRYGYEELVDWSSFPYPKARIQNIFYFASLAGNKFIGVITNGKLYIQVLNSINDKIWIEVPFYDTTKSFGTTEKINVTSYLDSVFLNREDGKVYLLDGLDLNANDIVAREIYFAGKYLVTKDVSDFSTKNEFEISSTSTDSLGKAIYDSIVNSGYISAVATGSNGLYLSYCVSYINPLDEVFYFVLDNPKCIGTNRTSSNPYLLKFDSSFRLIDYTSLSFNAGTSGTRVFGFGIDQINGFIYINSRNDQVSKIDVDNLAITNITGDMATYLSSANKVEASSIRWYSIGVGDDKLGIYSTYRQTTDDEIIVDHSNFNAVTRNFRILPTNEQFVAVFRDDSNPNLVSGYTNLGNVYFLSSNISSYNIIKKLTKGVDFTDRGTSGIFGIQTTLVASYNFGGNLYLSIQRYVNSPTYEGRRGYLIVLNQSIGEVYNQPVLDGVSGIITNQDLYISKFVRDYVNNKLYVCYSKAASNGTTSTHYISEVSNTASISHFTLTDGSNTFSSNSEIVSISSSHSAHNLLMILFRNGTSGSSVGITNFNSYLCCIYIDTVPVTSTNILATPTFISSSSTSSGAFPPIDIEFTKAHGYIFSRKGQYPKVVTINLIFQIVISDDTFQFNGSQMVSGYYYKRLEIAGEKKYLMFGNDQDIYVIDRTTNRTDKIAIFNSYHGLDSKWENIIGSNNSLLLYRSRIVRIDAAKDGSFISYIPNRVSDNSAGLAENQPYVLDILYSSGYTFFKRFDLSGNFVEAETYVVSKTDKIFEMMPIVFDDSPQAVDLINYSTIWRFGSVFNNLQRYLAYSLYLRTASGTPLISYESESNFGGVVTTNFFGQKIQNDRRYVFFTKDSNGYSLNIGANYRRTSSYLVNRSSDDSFIPDFFTSYTNLLRSSFIENIDIQANDLLSLKLLGAAKSPDSAIEVGTSGDDFYANYYYRYYLVYVLVGGTLSPISGRPAASFVTDVSGSFTSVTTFGSGNYLTGTLSNGDAIGFLDGTNPIPSGLLKNRTYFVIGATGTKFKISETLGGSEVSFDNSAVTFLFYMALQSVKFIITDINEYDQNGVSIYEREDIERIDIYRSEQPNGGVEGPKNFVASLEKDTDKKWFYTPLTPPFAEETYEDTVRVLASNIPDENLFQTYTCKDITVHKNRLVLGNIQATANNNVVQYSDVDLARSIAPDQVRAIESGDGDEITSILSLGDYLYIFKNSKIYAIYGDVSNGQLIDVSRTVGCPYRNLISVFDNKVIYFLNDYGIHAVAGTNYYFLSGDRLSNFFDPNRDDSIDFSNLKNNSTVYIDNEKREIHFYFPRKVSGLSQSKANFCIIYNVEQQAFKTLQYNSLVSERVDIRDLITNNKKTVIGNYDGEIFEITVNKNDNGNAINYKITTSEFFISSNFQAKRFKLIRVFGKFLTNMRISYYIDGEKFGGAVSFRESFDGKGIATDYPFTNGTSYRIAISIEGEAKNDIPFSVEEILIGYSDLKGTVIR